MEGKIIQIAVSHDIAGDSVLFALTDKGVVYERKQRLHNYGEDGTCIYLSYWHPLPDEEEVEV